MSNDHLKCQMCVCVCVWERQRERNSQAFICTCFASLWFGIRIIFFYSSFWHFSLETLWLVVKTSDSILSCRVGRFESRFLISVQTLETEDKLTIWKLFFILKERSLQRYFLSGKGKKRGFFLWPFLLFCIIWSLFFSSLFGHLRLPVQRLKPALQVKLKHYT